MANKFRNSTKITIILLIVQYVYPQDIYTYLPYPNEKKISEIDYIFDNGAFFQKQKYSYDQAYDIEKIEKLNPFGILISTDQYEYDKEKRISQISTLNTFNYPIRKKVFAYYKSKYIVTSYDEFENTGEIEVFDLKGRTIELLTYKGKEISFKYVYRYIYESPDSYDYYIYSPENELREKQTLKFDKYGRKSEVVVYDTEENIISRQEFQNNNDNQVLSITKYNAENKIIERTVFAYYPNKKIKSGYSSGENNEFMDKTIYNYNKKNLLIKEVSYGRGVLKPKPQFETETRYFYNENGKLTAIQNFNNFTGKKNLFAKEFYDAERRLIKETRYFDGKISHEILYKKGLEILNTRFYKNGAILDFKKSEYDSSGNLLLVTVTNADNSLKEKLGYKYDEKGTKTIVEF